VAQIKALHRHLLVYTVFGGGLPSRAQFNPFFTTDSKYVISSSRDKTVCIWNVESGSCVNVFKGHSDYVSCIALSHDIEAIAKDWPLTHHLVPSHLCLTICEILCLSRNVLPKDLRKYLVQTILQFGLSGS